MRLSISNIAWEPADDPRVAAVLAERGVDAIDVAPGKYFPDVLAADGPAIATVRGWWEDRGIGIVGMQALLFGTSGLNVFGDERSRSGMLRHLEAVARLAEGLGATRLTFGSPRNRDRGDLLPDEAERLAADFFRRAGDVVGGHGACLCLEPNPPAYGCNFMTRTEDAARVVRLVAHPAVRLQIDMGAVTMNGEDAGAVIAAFSGIAGHLHLSEPDLKPLGTAGVDHGAYARLIERDGRLRLATIEMLTKGESDPVAAIKRSVDFARSTYAPREGTP